MEPEEKQTWHRSKSRGFTNLDLAAMVRGFWWIDYGRGLRKTEAAIDLWKRDVAPTPSLRTWFGHRADRFTVFKRRYREELKSNPAVAEILKAIGDRKATLLYAARDTTVNHAVVLAEFLKKAAARGCLMTKLKGRARDRAVRGRRGYRMLAEAK